MPRYAMPDGTIVDPDLAVNHWIEDTYWDGRNQISVNTGSQWDHQHLYESRKGRFYVVSTSDFQHVRTTAHYLSHLDAARWLLRNHEPLPGKLRQYEEGLIE